MSSRVLCLRLGDYEGEALLIAEGACTPANRALIQTSAKFVTRSNRSLILDLRKMECSKPRSDSCCHSSLIWEKIIVVAPANSYCGNACPKKLIANTLDRARELILLR